MIDEISPFIIEELTGERRSVQLVDRALPYRPYTLKTSQRLTTTWYPGNPIATSQLYGAKEDPTTLDGMWKDKYIQRRSTTGENQLVPITFNGEAPENVRAAVELMDSIVRHGQLLLVKWDQQFRRGHLRSFEKRWLNVHDVEWTMEFEWISRDEELKPVVLPVQNSLSDTESIMRRVVNALRITALPVPFGVDNDFAVAMDAAISTLQADVDSLSATVSEVVRLSTTPLDASRRTVALLSGTIDRAQSVRTLVESEVMGGFRSLVRQSTGLVTRIRGSDPPPKEPIGDLSFGERLDGAAYSRSVTQRSEAVRRESIERREQFLLELEDDVERRVLARQGEDLRDVAFRELGDANQWRQLAYFNELRGTQLQAGQLVLIPRNDPGGCV